ncbi:MAG: short-chain dehydrogenase [Frankiales bacterium]|jgi:short-subunit dehydrogenase|nr:short-chain dehydrogenase [Frankiales bacterium]
MKLSGSHVLVTGASRGIGAHIAAGAAQRGATVTLVARSAEALAARATELGGYALPCDLGVPAEREGLVARAEAAAGRPVDVLVNVAGLDAVAGMLEVTAEQMRSLYEVNLLAPAELVRQVLPGMVARGRGHVVTVSSGFSTVTAPGLVPYASSKAGLSHFHAGVGLELRGTGIGLTLVEPGPVRTQMWEDIEEHGLSAAALERWVRLQLTRIVTPEEVAIKVLDGVEQGKSHVVPSRRMSPVLAFTWIPRRVGDLALTGVRRR